MQHLLLSKHQLENQKETERCAAFPQLSERIFMWILLYCCNLALFKSFFIAF